MPGQIQDSVFSSLGQWLIAVDCFNFPKLLAAGVEHMLLQRFSLPVIAEVHVLHGNAASTQQRHDSSPALAHSSPLGSAFVNLCLQRENLCSVGKPSA